MDVVSYLLGKQAGGGGSTPTSQTKSITITQNGTTTVSPDTGVDYLSSVDITTNVSGGGEEDLKKVIERSATSINIPSGTTKIGTFAFYYCADLTSVTIPSSITSIETYGFGYSGLTSISIPNSVTTIGKNAFSGCTQLVSATLPNNITKVDEYTFSDCSNLEAIVIPNSVTTIGKAAFFQCNKLASLTLGNSITSIENNAFSSCWALENIVFPPSITSIKNSAFSSCSGLKVADFRNHVSIPSVSTSSFSSFPSSFQIIVPDDLYNDWIVTSGWSTYTSHIVKASEV